MNQVQLVKTNRFYNHNILLTKPLNFENIQSNSVTESFLSFGLGGMLCELNMIRSSKKIDNHEKCCFVCESVWNQKEDHTVTIQSPVGLPLGHPLSIHILCMPKKHNWHFSRAAYCRFSIHTLGGVQAILSSSNNYQWLKMGEALYTAGTFK